MALRDRCLRRPAEPEYGGLLMKKDVVLIVDDDPSIRRLLGKVASGSGFDYLTASCVPEALSLARSAKPDLILLDIMMQGYDDGFDIIRTLRSGGNAAPILVLSGRGEDFDTLYGLEIGADDYITKPFNPVVLGAKMKALVRRSRQSSAGSSEVLIQGPFQYNTTTMELSKNETPIALSSKELTLMHIFLTHPGQVFTKEQLFEMVWNHTVADDSILMVYISHLRGKIEEDPKNPRYLKTVWGVGYKFQV